MSSWADDIGQAVNQAVVEARTADVELEYLRQRAPNVIEWAVGREWLHQPILLDGDDMDRRPHWGMYEVLRDFFELRCPNCNKGRASPWGKMRAELEDEVLLRYTRGYDDDVCPKCNTTRAEFMEDGVFNGYNTFHAVVGMRAGKSDTLALLATYIEHVLLTIAHKEDAGLNKYLGIPDSEILEITFLAASEVQSKDTIWAKFVNKRKLSPWFRRYVPWVCGAVKRQKIPEGMRPWRYLENEKEIDNELARIRSNSLNSNSGSLVGRTRPAAYADEIARMKQTDSSLGADEVYRGLSSSLETVRSAQINRKLRLRWIGLMASITSPVSVEDKGMRLLDVSKEDPRMYARRYATWEYNPRQPYENFAQKRSTDPIGAQRDFGADPPAAQYPLINDRMRFRKSAINWELQSRVEFQEYDHFQEFDVGGGKKEKRWYRALRCDRAQLITDTPHYVAFDAGQNFDQFAGACGHPEEIDDHTIATVFDWVFRILPQPGQEVWFDSVIQIVSEIHKFQRIVEVGFDRWNSVNLIQRIRELGVRAEQSAPKDDTFKGLMNDGYSGRLYLLPPTYGEHELTDAVPPDQKSAAAVAVYELERLDVDPKTGKVFNPRKGQRRGWNSDDVARVINHVNVLVQNRGFTASEDDTSRRARRKRLDVMSSEWSAKDYGTVVSAQTMLPGARFAGGGRGW